jgi:hypothetical protein
MRCPVRWLRFGRWAPFLTVLEHPSRTIVSANANAAVVPTETRTTTDACVQNSARLHPPLSPGKANVTPRYTPSGTRRFRTQVTGASG